MNLSSLNTNGISTINIYKLRVLAYLTFL